VLEFDVTSASFFPEDALVGVIDGDRTWPAMVDVANQDLEVFFVADPGLAAGTVVDLHGIDVVVSEDAATFTREDQALLMTVAMAGSAAGEVAIVQALRRATAWRPAPGSVPARCWFRMTKIMRSTGGNPLSITSWRTRSNTPNGGRSGSATSP
jgi:hypothetical protein